jgi:hypothetical protein
VHSSCVTSLYSMTSTLSGYVNGSQINRSRSSIRYSIDHNFHFVLLCFVMNCALHCLLTYLHHYHYYHYSHVTIGTYNVAIKWLIGLHYCKSIFFQKFVHFICLMHTRKLVFCPSLTFRHNNKQREREKNRRLSIDILLYADRIDA